MVIGTKIGIYEVLANAVRQDLSPISVILNRSRRGSGSSAGTGCVRVTDS